GSGRPTRRSSSRSTASARRSRSRSAPRYDPMTRPARAGRRTRPRTAAIPSRSPWTWPPARSWTGKESRVHAEHPDPAEEPAEGTAGGAAPEESADGGDRRGDVVIITGLAGAGRETAAHALEDMGWYVVYNIAPQLIPTLYELQATAQGRRNRFAVVVDPRSGPFFSELSDVVAELRRADLR